MSSSPHQPASANSLGTTGPVFQVAFSDQSMAEMNRLPIDQQLRLVDILSTVNREQLRHPREPLGKFHRDRKKYYRLRAEDYRFYFEVREQTLFVHWVLHRNTFSDFIFRAKLPVTEDLLVEQNQSFWKYLETLTR